MENSVQTNVQPRKEEWDWRKRKPNNMYQVEATSETDFYKWWLTLIEPFVKLTPREKDVISAFLKQRRELAQQVPPELVDRLLMGNETKSKILEECHLSLSHFYVVMSTLKKKNVISDKGIHPRLIPNVRKNDNGTFLLLLVIKGESA